MSKNIKVCLFCNKPASNYASKISGKDVCSIDHYIQYLSRIGTKRQIVAGVCEKCGTHFNINFDCICEGKECQKPQKKQKSLVSRLLTNMAAPLIVISNIFRFAMNQMMK